MPAPRTFTRRELEARNRRDDLVIIIDNLVYDVTGFLDDHPGGVEVLLDNGGNDASQCFHDVGHSDIALEWRQKFYIGELVEEDKREVLQRPSFAPEPDRPLTLTALLDVWGPPVALGLLSVLFYMYLLQ